MRVVIDTNVVIPMSSPRTSAYAILRGVALGRLSWLVSTAIHLEYLEKLAGRTTALSGARLRSVLSVSPFVVAVEPSYRFRLIHADEDDDKFVDCAVAGNADYLVTDDRHYRRLKDVEFPKLRVVTARQFLGV